jgi:uncharacterized protein YutE (UPF0331/DUF86 family)
MNDVAINKVQSIQRCVQRAREEFQSDPEGFDLLRNKSVIDADLAAKLKKMIGFRNTIIHEYQRMDLEIVKAVIVSGLDDLITFADRAMGFLESSVA